MPAHRYFSEEKLITGQNITLTGGELHHLLHVMREKVGAEVELVDGRGKIAKGKVIERKKQEATILLEEVEETLQDPFELIIAQALPRSQRLDNIVEKGTELGMTQLWLFPGEHSEQREINSKKIARVKSSMIAAMKQCGRLYLPKVIATPSLFKWEKPPYKAFFGDITPKAEKFSDVWKKKTEGCKGVIFFIGPEAGFSEKEIAWFEKEKIHGVKLHNNILRTDTAPLVALSLMYHWGMNSS